MIPLLHLNRYHYVEAIALEEVATVQQGFEDRFILVGGALTVLAELLLPQLQTPLKLIPPRIDHPFLHFQTKSWQPFLHFYHKRNMPQLLCALGIRARQVYQLLLFLLKSL